MPKTFREKSLGWRHLSAVHSAAMEGGSRELAGYTGGIPVDAEVTWLDVL